jgi:hypothetical protein
MWRYKSNREIVYFQTKAKQKRTEKKTIFIFCVQFTYNLRFAIYNLQVSNRSQIEKTVNRL